MDGDVIVGIPVSPEAAGLLLDRQRVEAVGKLISDLLHPWSPAHDPLAGMIAEIKSRARADGLTDADIDEELAAYNAEGRA